MSLVRNVEFEQKILQTMLLVCFGQLKVFKKKIWCVSNFSAASTSTDANLPIDNEDEVRAPIAPKRDIVRMFF